MPPQEMEEEWKDNFKLQSIVFKCNNSSYTNKAKAIGCRLSLHRSQTYLQLLSLAIKGRPLPSWAVCTTKMQVWLLIIKCPFNQQAQ